MRKSPVISILPDGILMDAEHINLIANQIEDLSNRVNELRGYL
jgi:hypothetical protein